MFLQPAHSPLLHVSCSVASPVQSAPLPEAGVDIDLVRDLDPSPHVAEQSPQLPKSPHTQSTKLGHLI